MISLERLYLSNNSLGAVPYNLPRTLHQLFLQDNRITALEPFTFSTLPQLKRLYVRGNRLTNNKSVNTRPLFIAMVVCICHSLPSMCY